MYLSSYSPNPNNSNSTQQIGCKSPTQQQSQNSKSNYQIEINKTFEQHHSQLSAGRSSSGRSQPSAPSTISSCRESHVSESVRQLKMSKKIRDATERAAAADRKKSRLVSADSTAATVTPPSRDTRTRASAFSVSDQSRQNASSSNGEREIRMRSEPSQKKRSCWGFCCAPASRGVEKIVDKVRAEPFGVEKLNTLTV